MWSTSQNTTPTTLPPSTSRNLPKRTDSLNPNPTTALFAKIEDDIRDAKRVHSHGQEEDLKAALARTVGRIEELTSLLKESYSTQTDLQNELIIAKSNLQLSLSNNEMLEDAIKRGTKDVGWKRWSAREERERERIGMDERHRSLDYAFAENGEGSPVSPAAPVMTPTSSTSTQSIPPPPPQDGRFFKFRFGSGASRTPSPSSSVHTLHRSGSHSHLPHSPLSPHPNPSPTTSSSASHLTSASLPSLLPTPSPKEFLDMKARLDELSRELEEVRKELVEEKEKKRVVKGEKERLEEEVEALSQALFEEANKMVATERIKRHETEEELRQTVLEKEALRQALKVIENENGRLRSAWSPEIPIPIPTTNGINNIRRANGLDVDEEAEDGEWPAEVGGHSRSSSAVGVKSRPTSLMSSFERRASIESVRHIGVENGDGNGKENGAIESKSASEEEVATMVMHPR